MNHPEFFLYGALGAASLELLKLYDYKAKLHLKKFQHLVKSPLFWFSVLGMLLASGFIAWAMQADRNDARVWEVVITGIAARSIVRELATATTAQTPRKLGNKQEEKISLRDVFS